MQEPEDDDDNSEEDEEGVEEEGLPSSSEDDEDHLVQLLVPGKRTRTPATMGTPGLACARAQGMRTGAIQTFLF